MHYFIHTHSVLSILHLISFYAILPLLIIRLAQPSLCYLIHRYLCLSHKKTKPLKALIFSHNTLTTLTAAPATQWWGYHFIKT